jgi:hypothetical protein
MLNWKHLQEVDETYFEHMFYAFKIIYKFTRLIGCMLTHAIFPFIFCNALEPTMRRVQQETNERKISKIEYCDSCGRRPCICFD